MPNPPRDGCWTAHARGYNTGIETCMGKTVVFEIGAVRVLIAERPAMTVDPELFRSHGEPLYCKIVAVKSPKGFRAAYEPIAKTHHPCGHAGREHGPPPTSHASRGEAAEG